MAQDHLVHLEVQGQLVTKDQLVLKVQWVLKVLWGKPDNRVYLDSKERQDHKDPKVSRETRDQ